MRYGADVLHLFLELCFKTILAFAGEKVDAADYLQFLALWPQRGIAGKWTVGEGSNIREGIGSRIIVNQCIRY